MSLLGLLIARRPVQVLGLLDPEPTTKILHNYLMPIFDRIKIAPCYVEERFGTVELLNAIPVLFHLADWTEAVVHLPSSFLPQSLATLCINLLHLISDDDAEHSADCPADLELFCELRGAIVHAATLYGNGVQLMRQRPSTFAMACLLEVQGRWQDRLVPVSEATCPCSPPPEVASKLTARERANYTKKVADMWSEYLPRLEVVLARCPALAFLRPIATALAGSRKPSKPADGGLLHVALPACMACALPGCDRVTAADGSSLLKICNGGCGGLARYCCVEHQKEHWKSHKIFCKRQDSTVVNALAGLQIAMDENGGQTCAEVDAVELPLMARQAKAAKKAAAKKRRKCGNASGSEPPAGGADDLDDVLDAPVDVD